jgi:hypothetical protein
VRIERGFIGAHADIGGGYAAAENGLSTVALSWMVAQAQIAGVTMKAGENSKIDMNNPIIHDQSNLIRFGDPTKAPKTFEVNGYFNGLFGTNTRNVEDRQVLGGLGGATQRTQTFGPTETGGNRSMTNADTNQYITFKPRPEDVAKDTRTSENIAQVKALKNQTGTVDMQQYMSWLRQHGYVFAGEY